jgi:hypothetical protein
MLMRPVDSWSFGLTRRDAHFPVRFVDADAASDHDAERSYSCRRDACETE